MEESKIDLIKKVKTKSVKLKNNITVEYLYFNTEIKNPKLTIILNHGSLGHKENWLQLNEGMNSILNFVLKNNIQIFIPDIRGHGKTTNPKTIEQYYIQYFSQDLNLLIEELELNNVIIWGYSLGSKMSFPFLFSEEEKWKKMYNNRNKCIGAIFGGHHPISDDFETNKKNLVPLLPLVRSGQFKKILLSNPYKLFQEKDFGENYSEKDIEKLMISNTQIQNLVFKDFTDEIIQLKNQNVKSFFYISKIDEVGGKQMLKFKQKFDKYLNNLKNEKEKQKLKQNVQFFFMEGNDVEKVAPFKVAPHLDAHYAFKIYLPKIFTFIESFL